MTYQSCLKGCFKKKLVKKAYKKGFDKVSYECIKDPF